MNYTISNRSRALLDSIQPINRFVNSALFTEHVRKPDVSDFAFGNPHDMPVAGFAESLARWSVPQDKNWFAYKMSEPESQRIVADSLRAWRGVKFEPNDIFMTNGAFAALAVALSAVLDPDDQVIFNTPPWFFYEALIVSLGARAVHVQVNSQTWDLDLDAIEAAITPRTRAILVNSPNNPSGKIYPPETLRALAAILEKHSARNGREIFLVSDEAYSKIIYDGRAFPSPASFYPYSFLIYTYGKTLLTPGQRIGFIALPPNMPREIARGVESRAVRVPARDGLFISQRALPQHARRFG